MQNADQSAILFSGTSHRALVNEVAVHLGWKLGNIKLDRFPDGEISVEIMESVRGRDTIVLQTTALDPDHYLMELLVIIDALKRASAKSVMAIIPYFGYCRQDRQDKPRVPITGKLVANLIEKAGATRVLTIDLHAGQLQGFFDIPVDNLHGRQPLAEAFRKQYPDECIVVAPDVGSIKIARAYARNLETDFAIVDKHRVSPKEIGVVRLIGDVKGKNVLLADDMCTTGGTLLSAAKACQEKGAKRIFAIITHGLFVGDSLEKIEKSPIEALFISNTIPFSDALKHSTKIKSVSIAPLLAKAIQCVITHESIASLYEINSD